ncbi:FAD-dependent oxidoreductase, partial [Clostridium botulinum]|nr:FAD-dependent oxidoreductase [Clostridium botulinum]
MVVFIRSGWAGCATAISTKNTSADFSIFGKIDLLLDLGNISVIMRNNGRFTAAEELIALGAGNLINITDENSKHKNIDF